MSLPNGAAGPSMTWKWSTCGWMESTSRLVLRKEKAAVLVVMAALSDGSKVVVSAVPGYRESTENWSEVLRDIKRRGLSCPRLVVGDGHLGIWGALRNVYPQAAEQRCWNHKIVKRARQASKATTGPGQAHAAYYPLRADSDRG